MMLYDIPSTTHVHLEVETVPKLSQAPNFIGIKDSSGDPDNLRELRRRLGGNHGFRLFVGAESVMRQSLLEGAL